jgi:hypothetical protein
MRNESIVITISLNVFGCTVGNERESTIALD